MNRKVYILIIPAFVLMLSWVIGTSLANAQAAQQAEARAAITTAFTYQGQLSDGGSPANGSYDFLFSLYDEEISGAQVGETITQTISVSEGLFTTMLDFGNVFNGDARYLEIAVQFSGGGYTTLDPRQALTAVPYASYAASSDWNGINNIPAGFADGVDNTAAGPDPANIIWVATSGGDFTSVNAALASITDATIDNAYLIKIAPGVYTETGGIDLKSYVDIEGSGNRTTFLRATGGSTNPTSDGSAATLRAGNVWAEVRSLHIDSYTSSSYAVAIWTTGAGFTQLRFTDVVAEAVGGSAWNVGIFNTNSSPFFDTFWVYNLSGSATSNYGVYNHNASAPTMNHGFVYVSGGTTSYGIYNQKSAPELNRVTITASGATGANIGLYNDGSSPVIVTHISSVASGGSDSYGIYNGKFNGVDSLALILDSYVKGSTNSVFTQGILARVYNSTLDGDVSSLNNCLDSHNEFGVALDTSCQEISAGEAVTWNDVASIPAGFADGVDNIGVDPANIVWVATSGGDYTSVTAALASISDASALNPYLIKVAPGVYTGTATLKAYVDIEGSGQGITILRGLGGAGFSGTLHAPGITPAEVRHLTVESITSATVGIGLSANGSDASLKFTHVSVIASGGTSDTYGIYNYKASPTLTDVTFSATGGTNTRGVFNQTGSSPAMLNVTVTATGGTNNTGVFNYDNANPLMTNVSANAGAGTTSYGLANYIGSAPVVRESGFSGVTSSIYNDGTSRVSYTEENIIRVARSGGDFTSLSNALASITDASAENSYVIKIAPGVYSETTGVDLKAYVDIEGSGEGVTVLRGFGSNADPSVDGTSATLRALGVITAEVRMLTVESIATGKTDGVPIWIKDTTDSFKMTHVTASGYGGVEAYGIRIQNASPILSSIAASATGESLVTEWAYGFLIKNSATPTLDTITASASGTITASWGILTELDSSPWLSNVTATGSGNQFGFGISIYNSSPKLVNIYAEGSSTGVSFGVEICGTSSSPTLQAVTAKGTGALDSFGISVCDNASAQIQDSTLFANGSISSYALYVVSDATAVWVANTLLEGTVVNDSTLTCVGAYDETFTALNTTCQ
jgi:pectin methylesterase-like acyl-CoA thioesterase